MGTKLLFVCGSCKEKPTLTINKKKENRIPSKDIKKLVKFLEKHNISGTWNKVLK